MYNILLEDKWKSVVERTGNEGILNMSRTKFLKWIGAFIGLLVLILVVPVQVEAESSTDEFFNQVEKIIESQELSIVIEADKTTSTKESILVTITANTEIGIDTIKWERGSQEISYFGEGGTILEFEGNSGTVTITENDTYTFYVKDKTGTAKIGQVVINNIDQAMPKFTCTYSVFKQKATVVLHTEDTDIENVYYIKGKLKDTESEQWIEKGTIVKNKKSFKLKSEGDYSILMEDKAGNKTIELLNVSLEMKAVWISFLEFGNAKTYNMSESKFKKYINKVLDRCVSMHMNAVIVHVRPYGDAMYPSDYFPWSKFASGKQGKSPGYDPLNYMIKAAHERNLEFHAWINPYRVHTGSTNVKKLSKKNPARKWRASSSGAKRRNVLSFGGSLYYNPAKSDVQNLIVNGVKEIVKNYDVDGIHFDDYFYPTLGSKYRTNFDYKEYKAYAKSCKAKGKKAKSIINWRRANVNTLVKKVYASIKKMDKEVQFGISPAGNIKNLYAKDRHYADVKTWLKSSQYIDYICPQIYWSFTHKICPYAKTVKAWNAIRKSDTVKLYVGLAAYRAGISKKEARAIGDMGWARSKKELKKQVEYARKTGFVDGYVFYRYDNMTSSNLKTELKNLKAILK